MAINSQGNLEPNFSTQIIHVICKLLVLNSFIKTSVQYKVQRSILLRLITVSDSI